MLAMGDLREWFSVAFEYEPGLKVHYKNERYERCELLVRPSASVLVVRA